MSAAIIAFPARRRARPEATFYAALREYAATRAKESLANLPAAKPAEDEILKLLRRIDRKLGKLSAEALPSAGRPAKGAASASF